MENNVKDRYGRKIEYIRISLTDRCNLRCIYCMPYNGEYILKMHDILTNDELLRLTKIFSKLGIHKLKLTGGEPLIRRDFETLTEKLSRICEIDEITLTTNGTHFEKLQKTAHLFSSVNVSLDTLKPDKYRYITGNGDIEKVFETLDFLKKENIVLKINTIPIKNFNDDEIIDFAEISKQNDISVKFIELMPIGLGKSIEGIPTDEVLNIIKQTYGKPVKLSYKGNGPAHYFTFDGFKGKIGTISAMSHNFCNECNRLRLTASGFLKTCLGFNRGVDLGMYLRSGVSDEKISALIKKAVMEKPLRNPFDNSSDKDMEKFNMNEIGG